MDFNGPFLGLNSAVSPHMLGPGFATVAENVIIGKGGNIRPREPFTSYAGFDPLIDDYVVGMIHLDRYTLVGFTGGETAAAVIAKTRGGLLKLVQPGGVDELAPDAVITPTNLQPTWEIANGWLYIIDGSEPLLRYDGSVLRTVGIEVPALGGAAGHVFLDWPPYDDPQPPVPPWPAEAYVRYAITFYDENSDTESNPSYAPSNPAAMPYHIGEALSITPRITYRGQDGPSSLPAGQGITHIRIYRRNVSISHLADPDDPESHMITGYPFYRLVAVLDATKTVSDPIEERSWTDQIQLDNSDPPMEDITLSDPANGPFAPSRNARPPAAKIACWYKSRMWYNDPEDGSKLWFSELHHPEYVAADNYLPIAGDPEDCIGGMVEMAGQLVVLKKQSIWILSGGLDWYTNKDAALGNIPYIQTPEVYRTKSKTGCDNTYAGNGVIVCGHPPMLYYTNAEGLYRFDGVDDVPVSTLIPDEWAELMSPIGNRAHNHAISFANDVDNQVLYISLTASGLNISPEVILCYHWGSRLWTKLGVKQDGSGIEQYSTTVLGCIATAMGKPDLTSGAIVNTSPLLVARVFYIDPLTFTRIDFADVDPSSPMLIPAWKWRTGFMPLHGDLKKSHVYRFRQFHELVATTSPLVYAMGCFDGKDFDDPANTFDISPDSAGQNVALGVLRERPVGREGRTLAVQFERGTATDYVAWKGITGFGMDIERAEPR